MEHPEWAMRVYLSINKLDDVLLPSEALQQCDFIHKALAGFGILALKLDALQGKYFPVWSHHLCQTPLPFRPIVQILVVHFCGWPALMSDSMSTKDIGTTCNPSACAAHVQHTKDMTQSWLKYSICQT